MKRPLPLLGIAVLVATLAGCGGSGGGTTTTAALDPIVFCVDTTYPPMESIVNGKPVGADIDIATAVAKNLGTTAQIKTTGFNVIIPALLHKKCNAIISAMTITAERSKQVNFVPYITVGSLLMVKKGNPSNVSDLASLSGKSAAVEASTTQLASLQAENEKLQTQGKAPITIKIFPADTAAAQAILSGHVDAYFADATPVLYYIRTTKGRFETVGSQVDTAPEGIATRKGDPLHARIQSAVNKLYSSGKMATILAKWQASQFALKQ